MNKAFNPKNTMGTLIMITTFVLLCLQYLNEKLKTWDDNARDRTLLQKSENIRSEQRTLIKLQGKASEKADLLVDKYNQLVDKQTEANTLQQTLNDFVTGGINKPRITVSGIPYSVVPGFENAPKQYQKTFKRVFFSVVNSGDHSIRDVSIVMFGTLGLEINPDGTPKDSRIERPYFVEWGPKSLDSGSTLTFHTGYYDGLQSGIGSTFFVMWKGGFYTMKARWEYTHPRGHELALREVKYTVGNEPVNDVQEFLKSR